MFVQKNSNLYFRKAMIFCLITGVFISGYLYFIKFEICGIVIDIFRMILIGCIIICFYKLIFDKWDRRLILKRIPFITYMFFFTILLIGCISTVLKGVLPGSLAELVAITTNCLLFLCLLFSIGENIELWIFSINVLKYTGIVVAIISCFEIILGYSLPSSRFNYIEYNNFYSFHPATSIFANENNLAAFFLVIVGIILFQMIFEKKRKSFILKGIQLSILLIPLTMADSTIFRLGVIVLLFFIVLCYLGIEGINKKSIFKSIIVVAYTIVLNWMLKSFFRIMFIKLNMYVVHGINVFNAPFNIDNKFIFGDDFLGQVKNSGMGTFMIRKNLFKYGILEGFKEPIIGNGPNSFQEIFKNNSYYINKTGGIIDPHNFIVELMVEYGIPVSLFFVFICIIIFVFLLKNIMNKKIIQSNKYMMGTILITLIAFCITTIMPSSFLKTFIYFIPFDLLIVGFNIIYNNIKTNKLIV